MRLLIGWLISFPLPNQIKLSQIFQQTYKTVISHICLEIATLFLAFYLNGCSNQQTSMQQYIIIVFLFNFSRILMNMDAAMNYNYFFSLIDTPMERFNRFGPKIVKMACVLLTISLGFTIFIVIEAAALTNDQHSLEKLSGSTYADFACLQLCLNMPNEQGGSCCEPDLVTCQNKFACYQSKISEYQTLINQETDFIDYFSIPAVFFLVSFIIAIIYFFKLKKKSLQEEHLIAIREALLANNYYQGMEEYDEFEEFQNYNAFLQYMMQQDQQYDIQPANEKKGDLKITDSFLTNDDTTCPICMMEFREEKVLRLRCHHKFHSSCIRDWNQANSSCPICRGDIYQ